MGPPVRKPANRLWRAYSRRHEIQRTKSMPFRTNSGRIILPALVGYAVVGRRDAPGRTGTDELALPRLSYTIRPDRRRAQGMSGITSTATQVAGRADRFHVACRAISRFLCPCGWQSFI